MLPTMPGLIGFPAFSPFPYGPSAAFAYPLAYPARPPFSLGGASFDFATQHMPGALSSFPRDGCVILVNNLDETKVTPDVLFTLFGVYADVAKVKILFNKKESALVEVMDPQQASIAVSHLEGVPLYGRPLHLMLSRHKSVQLPKDSGGPVEGRILNKDFSDSNLHRFRKPGSRNFRNIVAPSATLHLSNIPDDVSEDRIKEIFMKQKMPEILSFRFLNPKEPKEGRKMALAQFGSIEDAVYSLIFMHDYKIDDKLNLRVSFSKLDC
ncbi:polypyrimidine tract-binding protein 3-like [Zophobas morio]|uniref:polypyrimidine tract-binding protein 3-like n=1 Tax=Zophobas morio TaxID=2755281 RepID=UPI003083E491